MSINVFEKALKRVYGDLHDYLPDFAHYTKLSLAESQKQGDVYIDTLVEKAPMGVSFLGASDTALGDFVPGKVIDVQVPAFAKVLRESISSRNIARSLGAPSKGAFIDQTKLVMEQLMASLTRVLEVEALHGQDLGHIDDAAQTGASTTDSTCDVVASTWAPGIWASFVGAQVEVRLASNPATVLNSGGVSHFILEDANHDTKTLQLSSGTPGLVTALRAIAAPHVIVLRGAYTKSNVGLISQASNTGTVFSASGPAVRGNAVTTSGALTMAKIEAAIVRTAGRGSTGDRDVVLSHDAFVKLAAAENALRRYMEGDGKVKSGTATIEWHTSSGGMLKLRPSIFQKAGTILIHPSDAVKLTGSTKAQLGMPGGGPVVEQLENAAAAQVRAYAECACFLTDFRSSATLTGFDL